MRDLVAEISASAVALLPAAQETGALGEAGVHDLRMSRIWLLESS
jgi:hypothetical protein